MEKKIMASDEVWEEYLKSHPSHKKLQTECSVDYDDLQLVIGVGTATGNDSMALGANDTRFICVEEMLGQFLQIDCIEAIEGIHIPATVMRHDNSSFHDRHGNISQNVLAASPYRDVRYHLQDFAGNGNDPENEKELFNLRQASLRNVIERIFEEYALSSSPIVEKELEELVSQTQEQQKEEANAWTLNIADHMWRERY
ncbi:hypothetical protein Dsin_015929 [Dipteronia sinensis]|uniref:Uncharacterized protein n=1 Tax=Dipteronia sinensis TaxID=43782 RepID=A0AAE0E6G4_9ROSI|nr:hypothetical protein Dsin_015929 [Dipteronia sinensis]